MVGPQTLNLSILVRIQVWQPKVPCLAANTAAGSEASRQGLENLASIFLQALEMLVSQIYR